MTINQRVEKCFLNSNWSCQEKVVEKSIQVSLCLSKVAHMWLYKWRYFYLKVKYYAQKLSNSWTQSRINNLLYMNTLIIIIFIRLWLNSKGESSSQENRRGRCLFKTVFSLNQLAYRNTGREHSVQSQPSLLGGHLLTREKVTPRRDGQWLAGQIVQNNQQRAGCG